MAFQSAANNNRNSQRDEQNDNWKAQAFINIYVPRADGSKAKIGAIPLKTAKKLEAALIERLKTEEGLKAFANNVLFDFQMADNDAPVELAF